ncbi:hypothetical protein LXL04_019526 [Taraxacum kok-saghyz]
MNSDFFIWLGWNGFDYLLHLQVSTYLPTVTLTSKILLTSNSLIVHANNQEGVGVGSGPPPPPWLDRQGRSQLVLQELVLRIFSPFRRTSFMDWIDIPRLLEINTLVVP